MEIKWSRYPEKEEINKNIKLIAVEEIEDIVFGLTEEWENAAPVKKLDTIHGMLLMLTAINRELMEAIKHGTDL